MDRPTDLKRIRERAGLSRAHAAARAGVTEHLAHLFELGGAEAVRNEDKRAALVRVYTQLAGDGEGAAA
jgi:transcriptional regulator with XRE-family HTH domain